jgi:hypothetical protein
VDLPRQGEGTSANVDPDKAALRRKVEARNREPATYVDNISDSVCEQTVEREPRESEPPSKAHIPDRLRKVCRREEVFVIARLVERGAPELRRSNEKEIDTVEDTRTSIAYAAFTASSTCRRRHLT